MAKNYNSSISIPKGSIKRTLLPEKLRDLRKFQFQKVRLKVLLIRFIPLISSDFNSKRFD